MLSGVKLELLHVLMFTLLLNLDPTLRSIAAVAALIALYLTYLINLVYNKKLERNDWLIVFFTLGLFIFWVLAYFYSVKFLLYKVLKGFLDLFVKVYTFKIVVMLIIKQSPIVVERLIVEDFKEFKDFLFYLINLVLIKILSIVTYPLRSIVSALIEGDRKTADLYVDKLILFLAFLLKIYAYLLTSLFVWWLILDYVTSVSPSLQCIQLRQEASSAFSFLSSPIKLVTKPLVVYFQVVPPFNPYRPL